MDLVDVRRGKLVSVVQVATQVLVGGGKRAEQGLGRQLNWVVHDLGTLVSEKVQAVEDDEEDNEVPKSREARHDGGVGKKKKVVEAIKKGLFVRLWLGEGTVGTST